MKNTVSFIFGVLFFLCFPVAIALLAIATPFFFLGANPVVSMIIIMHVAPICGVLTFTNPTFTVVRELVTPGEHIRLVRENMVRQGRPQTEEWLARNKNSYAKLYAVGEAVFNFKTAVNKFYKSNYSIAFRAILLIVSVGMLGFVVFKIPMYFSIEVALAMKWVSTLNVVIVTTTTLMHTMFGGDVLSKKEA